MMIRRQFTPVSLATANLVDPQINVTTGANLTFTLSARGGVAPFTWLDHPAGTVGFFADNETGLPSNGFFLVPGIDRTGKHCLGGRLVRVRSRLTLYCSAIHPQPRAVDGGRPGSGRLRGQVLVEQHSPLIDDRRKVREI